MTNETEKAGAVAVLDGECFNCGNIKFHREGCQVASIHAELSALRASRQAPVERLPDGCPHTAWFAQSLRRRKIFGLLTSWPTPSPGWTFTAVEINIPGTAARLAALENKEKKAP